MKYKWLQKLNNDKLIIFFNGWGMDDFIVSHLDCEGFDVIVFYDYNDLSMNINFSDYKEKHLISWSMGVMIATNFDFGILNSATAICGTLLPIDNKFGIPQKIYDLTVKGYSAKSVNKFMERMFIEKPNINQFSTRTLENQKNELIKIKEYRSGNKFNYTKSIVGDSDLIIPTKNQLNFWENPIVIHSGHCPFMLYNKWTEILEL